jgi:hypothetical protein
MTQFFKSFFDRLSGLPWERFFDVARSVFIFLDVVLVIAFIAVLPRALEYRPKFYFHPERKRKKTVKNPEIIRRWRLLRERAFSNPPQSFVWAIIEADKFVDSILIQMKLPGEHMADRLERLSARDLKSLDNVWRAHRIRNELVHQPDYNISQRDAEEVLKLYEDFLKELEII